MEVGSVRLERLRAGAPSESAEDTLAWMRAAPLRAPRAALELASRLALFSPARVKAASRAGGAMGESYWNMVEQLAYAAADVADQTTFESCVALVKATFGATWRSKRLLAVRCEARGELSRAQRLYSSILTEDPCNRAAFKRQVAWLRGCALYTEASLHLSKYLQVCATDVVAWAELADLYITLGKFPQAIYCYNEMLLYAENDWAVFLRLAEVHYNLDTREHLLFARQYYAKSLTINRRQNVRAVYGLLLSTRNLRGSFGNDSDGAARNEKLLTWAQNALESHYKTHAAGTLPHVQSGLFVKLKAVE